MRDEEKEDFRSFFIGLTKGTIVVLSTAVVTALSVKLMGKMLGVDDD